MGTSDPGPPGDLDQPHDTAWSAAAEFTRWRAGDPSALAELVRRLSPRLWHVARAYGLGSAAAEDAVQQAWLTLVKHADTIRQPAAVTGWITTVTRREATRLAMSTRREVIGTDLATLERPSPAETAPPEVAMASDEARRLWSHIARLSERCRRLLRVVAFDDRPDYRSLADQLDMPIGSIGPTRRRCLEKLQAQLAADPAWSYQ